VIKAGAHAELLALAELAQAPVTTTLMARGAFPDPHPLALGMPGMHGCYTAVAALQEADLVVALGARFDDRVTGNLATFAPHAKIVHADIDPAEIGKNRVPDVPIVGDVRAAMAGLTGSLAAAIAEDGPPDTGQWLRGLDDWKRRFPLRYSQEPDGPLKPQHVVERLSALTGGEAVVVAGVGQHQMHAAQHYSFTKPRSWINSGGAGTMGFAVPAAMGAEVGSGVRPVVLCGDGAFQMTGPEISHSPMLGAHPIVIVVNNSGWQIFRPVVDRPELLEIPPWPYAKLAEDWDGAGFVARTLAELRTAMEAAHESKTFAIIDARVAVDDLSPITVKYIQAAALRSQAPPPANQRHRV
jgi:acetolactate synthase I/II/III large subunit